MSCMRAASNWTRRSRPSSASSVRCSGRPMPPRSTSSRSRRRFQRRDRGRHVRARLEQIDEEPTRLQASLDFRRTRVEELEGRARGARDRRDEAKRCRRCGARRPRGFARQGGAARELSRTCGRSSPAFERSTRMAERRLAADGAGGALGDPMIAGAPWRRDRGTGGDRGPGGAAARRRHRRARVHERAGVGARRVVRGSGGRRHRRGAPAARAACRRPAACDGAPGYRLVERLQVRTGTARGGCAVGPRSTWWTRLTGAGGARPCPASSTSRPRAPRARWRRGARGRLERRGFGSLERKRRIRELERFEPELVAVFEPGRRARRRGDRRHRAGPRGRARRRRAPSPAWRASALAALRSRAHGALAVRQAR